MSDQIKMPTTRNRGDAIGKAARENLTACGGPLQTRAQRRQQLADRDGNDDIQANAERERLEAETEDLRDRERDRPKKAEARKIRQEELAVKKAVLEAEVACQREIEVANR